MINSSKNILKNITNWQLKSQHSSLSFLKHNARHKKTTTNSHKQSSASTPRITSMTSELERAKRDISETQSQFENRSRSLNYRNRNSLRMNLLKQKRTLKKTKLNVIIQCLNKVLSDSQNQTTQAISLKHNVRYNLITTILQ